MQRKLPQQSKARVALSGKYIRPAAQAAVAAELTEDGQYVQQGEEVAHDKDQLQNNSPNDADDSQEGADEHQSDSEEPDGDESGINPEPPQAIGNNPNNIGDVEDDSAEQPSPSKRPREQTTHQPLTDEQVGVWMRRFLESMVMRESSSPSPLERTAKAVKAQMHVQSFIAQRAKELKAVKEDDLRLPNRFWEDTLRHIDVILRGQDNGQALQKPMYKMLLLFQWLSRSDHCKPFVDAWRQVQELEHWRGFTCDEQVTEIDIVNLRGAMEKATHGSRFSTITLLREVYQSVLPSGSPARFLDQARIFRDRAEELILRASPEASLVPECRLMMQRLTAQAFHAHVARNKGAFDAIKDLLVKRDDMIDIYDDALLERISKALQNEYVLAREMRSKDDEKPHSAAKRPGGKTGNKRERSPTRNNNNSGHRDNAPRRGNQWCDRHHWCGHDTQHCQGWTKHGALTSNDTPDKHTTASEAANGSTAPKANRAITGVSKK